MEISIVNIYLFIGILYSELYNFFILFYCNVYSEYVCIYRNFFLYLFIYKDNTH